MRKNIPKMCWEPKVQKKGLRVRLSTRETKQGLGSQEIWRGHFRREQLMCFKSSPYSCSLEKEWSSSLGEGLQWRAGVSFTVKGQGTPDLTPAWTSELVAVNQEDHTGIGHQAQRMSRHKRGREGEKWKSCYPIPRIQFWMELQVVSPVLKHLNN